MVLFLYPVSGLFAYSNKLCHGHNLLQVMRFFTNPHKPMILALSRPDPKKNVTTLLKAFGECKPLRELANLVTPHLFAYSKIEIESLSNNTS